MKNWTSDSIPWDLFDPTLVSPELIAQAKGASLVESNAADYVVYLRQVFAGEEDILKDIDAWGEEERLHGDVLRRWSELADPSFNFDASMERFKSAYKLPELPNEKSVRGSRARELVSRCVVETGTATFYTALRDCSKEPVFKEICRRIAGDEIRHYNLFLRYLNDRYAKLDRVGRLKRVLTIKERVSEVEDPELTLAYFAANDCENFDAQRFPEYSRQYMARTVHLYKPRHFQATVPLLGKAAGFDLRPWLKAPLGNLFHRLMTYKYH